MEHKRKRHGRRKLTRESALALLTAAELAIDGFPVGTIYRMAKAGLIPCYRTGVTKRGIRFNRDEVLRAIRQPAANESQAATAQRG
ncbi:MAG: hypothetical protein HOP32_16370 [Nitrospira sp.]|nr:hypothetical protein [Nitrospira sp.]